MKGQAGSSGGEETKDSAVNLGPWWFLRARDSCRDFLEREFLHSSGHHIDMLKKLPGEFYYGFRVLWPNQDLCIIGRT